MLPYVYFSLKDSSEQFDDWLVFEEHIIGIAAAHGLTEVHYQVDYFDIKGHWLHELIYRTVSSYRKCATKNTKS